jgi:hypothetical protein
VTLSRSLTWLLALPGRWAAARQPLLYMVLVPVAA